MPPKTRKGKKTQRASKGRRVSVRSSYNLDPQALAYAHLLNDPCSAPLVHPVYAGSDGGLVARFENYYTLNTTAVGSTSGLFSWTPGGIGNNAGAAPALITGEQASAGTAFTTATLGTTTQPGWAYLSTNSGASRCVAACIQVMFVGAESARSGIVAYGGLTGSTIASGVSTNASNALQLFEKYERMPVSSLEVKWRPGSFDQEWTNPNSGTSATELGRRSAVGLAWVGAPASTGIIVRMVAVYEYVPILSSGLVVPYNSRSTSSSSLDHVVNALDSTGEWMYNAGRVVNSAYRVGQSAMPYVRAIAYAGSRALPMLGM